MQTHQQIEKQLSAPADSFKSQTSKRNTTFFGIISGALSLLFLIVIGIIVLEVLFRMARIGEGESQSPDLLLGSKHIPGKMVTFRLEGYSHENINSYGMRDIEHPLKKSAGVTRIAVLGDSTTEAMQVSQNETYAAQLESQLNKGTSKFEVLNFGCAGYSTGQEMLQYERQIRQFKPDIVVVLYNLSDSAENIFVPQSADKMTPRPYFHLENNALIQDDSVLKFNSSILQSSPFMNFVRRESRIYGVFAQQNLMLSINEPLYVKIKRIVDKASFPGHPPRHTGIIRPTYNLADPIAVTTGIFTHLNDDVRRDGASLVVMTFPNIAADKSFAKEEAALQKTGQEQNFAVISLTQAFTEAPNCGNLFLKYHFSRDGHKVVANVLSSFIEQTRH